MSGLSTHAYPHLFPVVAHTLYKANPRVEQGFYGLSTHKGSSYYDYLYIHTSSYANNLSTNIYTNEDLKSRDRNEIYSRAICINRWS
jgi:hypothetical protein